MIPSIPGYAFSGPTTERGWNTRRVARAWAELMHRLGYERYGAAGNDWGSDISIEVGRFATEAVVGVHVTQIFSLPFGEPGELEGMADEANLCIDTSFTPRWHSSGDQSAPVSNSRHDEVACATRRPFASVSRASASAVVRPREITTPSQRNAPEATVTGRRNLVVRSSEV